MIGGYVSSAILAVSGLAGVIMPERVGRAIHTDLSPPRARAEFRVAYGTLAALGAYAVVVADTLVFRAVGVVWLGAAIVRLTGLVLDRPRADWTYWAYLILEVGLGAAAVLTAGVR